MNPFHLFLVNAVNLAIQASCFSTITFLVMWRLFSGEPVLFQSALALLFMAVMLAHAAQELDHVFSRR